MTIRKLSVHIIWLMTILEAVAVPLVAFFAQTEAALQPKQPGQGFLIGFMASYVIVFIFNRFGRFLQLHIGEERLVHVGPLGAVVWNGVVLECIFLIQDGVAPLVAGWPFLPAQACLGFLSVGGAIFLIGGAYKVIVRRWPRAGLRFFSATRGFTLGGFTLFSFVFYAGVYEMVAFPVINLWQLESDNIVAAATGFGALGGLVGVAIVYFLYRVLPVKCSITFFVE